MSLYFQDFLEKNKNKQFQHKPIPKNHPNPMDWIIRSSDSPWLEILGIDAPYKEMLKEARNLKDLFVFHRGEENSHRGWKSLAIHGISADKTNVPETYGLDPSKVKYKWTEIQDRCPITVKFFKTVFPYREYQRVRFMLLEPQGYIAPHSDHHESFLGTAVNISLNNPVGCNLVTELGTMPFKDSGSAFLFNTFFKHSVYNDSTEDRFHIIVHGAWNNDFSKLILNSYNKLF